jgi:hypothetical protein
VNRDRDRILEDALKHELKSTGMPAGENCVDAETLAAWQDDALKADAAAMVETHLSSCSRCQAMAAAFARSSEALGTTAPTEAPGTFAVWKWLAPLAAGAAAVTVWMVIPEQREVAMAPPVQPAAESTKQASAGADPVAPAAPAAPDAPAAPANLARQDAAARKEEPARSEQALAETVTVVGQSPMIPSPAAPPPPAPSAAPAIAGLRARAQFAAEPFEIVSPDSRQRWRVSPAGVERSLDIGGSWSLVRAATGEVLTAGVSPSPGVCWLIGNNGVVLLTTNGSVFTRVDIPSGDNLRSITATDARSAAVVNASGRTFRTDDGGQTWR